MKLKFLIFFSILLLKNNLLAEKITLSDAISKVLTHNGEVLGAKARIKYGEGLISQAKAGFAPKATLDLFAAPIFAETGNAVSSQKDYKKWGILTGIRLSVLQPIYTFGMISSYKKAAQYGAKAYEADFKLKKQELIYKTKQFYYGVMLANDLVEILTEAKEKIEETVEDADGDNGAVARGKMKLEDLYALKTFAAMLMPKYDEAIRTQKLAMKALKWVMMENSDEIKLEDNTISPEDIELKSLSEYKKLMLKHRPEVQKLNNGVLAKKELYEATNAGKYPMLFALGTFNFAHTGIRDDQNSAFAYDPYNDMSGAFIIGLRLNLDWWSINAKAKQKQAEYEELFRAQKTLTDGMKLQLEKAYLECLDYKKSIDYAYEAEKNAKKWLMNAFLGYSMGTAETDKLTDALKAYFGAKLEYNMSIYNYNMALAQMTKLVGVEVLSRLDY